MSGTSEPADSTPPAQATAPARPGTTTSARPAGPFAGVPIGDYLTDVVALVLFLVSLGMPWAGVHRGSFTTTVEHVPALLVTLLGAVALATHYLVRAGVVPWGGRQGWLLRAGAAVVYVLVALVYVVIACVDLLAGTGRVVGPAPGMAFGLAAAVLLGLPRWAEVTALGGPQRSGRIALRTLAVVGWLIVALGLVVVVALLIDPDAGWRTLLLGGSLLLVVGVTLITAIPVLLLATGGGTWRVPVIALGSAFVVLALLSAAGSTVGVGWGGAFLLLPAAVAAAAHPALPWATGLAQPRERGVQVASHTWQLVVATAAYAVVFAVLVLIDGGAPGRAVAVARILLAVFVAVAVLVARAVLLRDPVGGLPTAAVATGTAALGGLVLLVMAAAGSFSRVTWVEIFLAFAAPLAVGYALIGPVRGLTYRELFGSAVSSSDEQPAVAPAPAPAPTPAASSAPSAPSPPSPPEPEAAPGHWFTAEQASDPATPAQVLADIAAAAPELRPAVAANPSAYPGLLEWLGSLDDPDVDAALDARRGAAG